MTSSSADHADQPAGRVHERVARVAHERVAVHGIAVAVVGADLPHRVPGAEVAPAGVERDHADRDARSVPARRLHHRVVDALGRNGRERRGVEAQERGVDLRAAERRFARRGDVGPEAAQRIQPHARAQDEHAAVPVVAAIGDVALRRRQVGLLDEGSDRPRFLGGALYRAGADVAVAGVRPLRPDAENDDAAERGGAHRRAHRRREVGAAGDRVIGGA